jgi:high-affinity nickel-transport protein
VVAILGAIALFFGALLPGWVDPIMGRVVGVTLIVLGVWVFYSLYAYVRHGTEFRLRSRWMLVFSSIQYGWRWLRAKLHGHDHVDPVEASSYGPRTAFGVGMIHGIGAETGSQVLIIAAVGGATSLGLGIPMMLAFIVGLLISNSLIVFLTATGFVASQLRQRIYVVIGVVAGVFSLVIGALFLFEAEAALPDLNQIFGVVGS